MAVWWYYKSTKYSTIEDQTEAALSIKYDTRLCENRWLGAHPHAKQNHCNNVIRLIAKDKLDTKRPVKRGDILWVYDIFCLGSTNKKLLEVITACHESGVHLCVYTQQYRDIERADGTNDYNLLREVLIAFISRADTHSKKRKKAGRPRRGIRYISLPYEGKEIIDHYHKQDGKYTRDTAMRALQEVLPDRKPIGKDTFYRLLSEYRRIEAFRSKRNKK